MENVVDPKCKFEGCNKRPSCNYKNEKRGLYCKLHKLPDMENVVSTKCAAEGCDKIPNYNYQNCLNGLYCKTHKLENMFDVKHKLCEADGCLKRAGCNFRGQKTPRFCAKHAEEGMIFLNAKICEVKDCDTYASYNFEEIKKPMRCGIHRLEGMKNVKNRVCLHEGCDTAPTFNYCEESKGLYCESHRLPGMMSIKSKRCQETSCKQLALFGIPDKRAQFCEHHKEKGMINVVTWSECSVDDCNEDFKYTHDGKKYCHAHVPSSVDFETVQKRLCKYCDLAEKSKFVCRDCSMRSAKKEWMVIRHLRENIDDDFIHDKILNGCSRRRPDAYFDLREHVVIVDIDEHQHEKYEESCECARLNDIVNDVGGRPVTVIRFNPDKVHWGVSEKKINMKERLETLVKVVKREILNRKEQFGVEVIQLYYDVPKKNGTTFPAVQSMDVTNIVAV